MLKSWLVSSRFYLEMIFPPNKSEKHKKLISTKIVEDPIWNYKAHYIDPFWN